MHSGEPAVVVLSLGECSRCLLTQSSITKRPQNQSDRVRRGTQEYIYIYCARRVGQTLCGDYLRTQSLEAVYACDCLSSITQSQAPYREVGNKKQGGLQSFIEMHSILAVLLPEHLLEASSLNNVLN